MAFNLFILIFMFTNRGGHDSTNFKGSDRDNLEYNNILSKHYHRIFKATIDTNVTTSRN